MDFPQIYHKHKDVEIGWRYVWGKLNDGWHYFHAASFNVGFDKKKLVSTHSSIHTIAPKYTTSEYSESLGGEAIKGSDRWWHFRTDQLKITVPAIGGWSWYSEYVYHINHGREHCSMPRAKVTGMFQTSRGVWRHLFEENVLGWIDEEYSQEPWANLIYKENGIVKVNNWDWVAIRINNGPSIMACKQANGDNYCTIIDRYKGSKVDFILSDNFLSIPEIELEFEIKPLVKEKIFHPEIGMKYSETPVIIFSGKEEVGYGMRERTYGGIDEKSLIGRMYDDRGIGLG